MKQSYRPRGGSIVPCKFSAGCCVWSSGAQRHSACRHWCCQESGTLGQLCHLLNTVSTPPLPLLPPPPLPLQGACCSCWHRDKHTTCAPSKSQSVCTHTDTYIHTYALTHLSPCPHPPPHPPTPLRCPCRKLAVQWHPDKHINNQEEAKKRFQAISEAYNNLMSTNEDDRVEQLAQG
jgi:hypothetical protein